MVLATNREEGSKPGVLEVLGFENFEEELHGWVLTQDLKPKDPWCSGLMVHPLFLQAAAVAELVGFGVELARAGCQDLLYG